MSSMTDLVFLLLIFFIIVSTLVSPYVPPLELPYGKHQTSTQPNIAVSIDPDYKFYINDEVVAIDMLEGELKKRLSADESKQNIVLNVDQTIPAGLTVKVLDIAKRNHWKVILATKPQK